jgi:YebC/PmpR family DNA-binding regulatory protein
MSGHSKWATIKRSKAANDAKKGAAFTKVSNMITVAAREKGGDPETNFSLRVAIDKARQVNMPKDNIEKAIKRGTGELGGAQIEELIYEGIGPAKAQFVVKCLTDNKNRSAGNIRHLFTKYGGSFGAVMWNFSQKGVIRVASENLGQITDRDAFELELIDAGAQDIKFEEEGVTVVTSPEDLVKVKKLLDEKGVKAESAEIEYLAKDEASAEGDDREKIEKFMEELEDNEDVSDYYTNVNL